MEKSRDKNIGLRAILNNKAYTDILPIEEAKKGLVVIV